MDYDKIEIELGKEEQSLLNEIHNLQSKMNDVDPEKLNGQLMDAIKQKSIDTITMALGLSDIMEMNAHSNGEIYEKEYKRKMKWENTPRNERSETYSPKYIPKTELDKLTNVSKNISPYVYKEDRDKYTKSTVKIDGENVKLEGRSQIETVLNLRRENKEGFYGEYSEEFMKHGEQDESKKYSYDHGYSVKEVHNDPIIGGLLSLKEKRDFLNSTENLLPVNALLNKSLGATKVDDMPTWYNKINENDPSKTNGEYFKIDEKHFNKKIKELKTHRKITINSKKIKYDYKAQGKIAVSNAAASGAKAAIGKLLSITVVEVMNEFKNKEEVDFSIRVSNITTKIKAKTKDVLKSFGDHSLNSFLSTIADAILNSVFKIAKNIFKFVKMAFLSILKAVRILFSSEYTWEERLKEAMKIMGMTVAGLIGIALDELIEKGLVASFPFTAPFAGYISPVLSGLMVGISSVLIIQGFQKYQSQIEFSKLKTDEAAASEKLAKVNLTQSSVSDYKATESVSVSLMIFQGALPIITSCRNQIDLISEDFKGLNASLNNKWIDLDNTQNNTDDLLGQLESM